MIDFWATWCPPCQKPIAHNQAMVEEHKDAWGGKVRIIGVSIDKDAPTVKNHVEKNGWTSVEHYHRAKSSCSDDYEVGGVPHILIIGPDGKIAFAGHPASRKNLAKDFTDLLEGKSLECVEDSSNPTEPAGLEDGKRMGEIMGQMDNFNKVVGPNLQKACKDKAVGMMRDFCVLTLSATFYTFATTDNKWKVEYDNHRVIVGKKEQLEYCKGEMVKAMSDGWTFEINEQ